MKRRMISAFLALMMLLAVLPLTALADAAANISVNDAVYYSNGALKSITAKFDWTSASVSGARLILMNKRLNGSYPTKSGYGDFTNLGKYGKTFKTYAEAAAHDKSNAGVFGFIQSSNETNISMGSKNNTITLSIPENTIPMDKNGTYYIYLWVTYRGYFYPDNLICVIQVQDGVLQYTPGIEAPTYRNHYNANDFQIVESQSKYDVTVTPAANMTRVTTSGAESQKQLSSAMTPVIYTADAGYYFPDTYSVAPVNGIMVKQLSDSQIQVYGTPSSNAAIALIAPDVKTNTHNCLSSGWKWDETNHWRWLCTTEGCQNYHVQSERNIHGYTDDYDTTCNTCGYVRVAPAQHPETGDITHIPMWAMIFFAGAALLWVQLAQRKRTSF